MVRIYRGDIPYFLLFFVLLIGVPTLASRLLSRPAPVRAASVTVPKRLVLHRAPVTARHPRTHRRRSEELLQAELARCIQREHPHASSAYAQRVSWLIVHNARAAHLPLEAVAATASIESDFSMHSGPCIGMMQINPATFHERHEHDGLNPHHLSDNVRLGVRELAYHYCRTSSSDSDHHRLAVMWGHYNGAGTHSSYVRRAFKAYSHFRHLTQIASTT